MNNKLLIAIVVILLLGGGLFFVSNRNKTQDTSMETPTDSENTVSSNMKSLKDMLTAGVPQSCSFSDTNDDMNTKGTTYISGGKMRADYEAVAGEVSTSGHMIYDGEASYIWADGQPNGIKVEIDPSETNTNGNTQGIDLDKQIDYDCGVWIPDESKFTPPQDVTFSSFTVPQQNNSESNQTESQNYCSACESLTGEQKTQCMTALNCN